MYMFTHQKGSDKQRHEDRQTDRQKQCIWNLNTHTHTVYWILLVGLYKWEQRKAQTPLLWFVVDLLYNKLYNNLKVIQQIHDILSLTLSYSLLDIKSRANYITMFPYKRSHTTRPRTWTYVDVRRRTSTYVDVHIEHIDFNCSIHTPHGHGRWLPQKQNWSCFWGNLTYVDVCPGTSTYVNSACWRWIFISCHRFIMDTEKLIECVKTRSILYECTRKSYRDTSKKDSAWAQVAVEMGEGVTGMSSFNFL